MVSSLKRTEFVRYSRFQPRDPRNVRPEDKNGNVIPRLNSDAGKAELIEYFKENPTLRLPGEDILAYNDRQRRLEWSKNPSAKKTKEKPPRFKPNDPRTLRSGETAYDQIARLQSPEGKAELAAFCQANPYVKGYGEDTRTYKRRVGAIDHSPAKKKSRKPPSFAEGDPRRQRPGETLINVRERLRTEDGALELAQYLKNNPPPASRIQQLLNKPFTTYTRLAATLQTRATPALHQAKFQSIWQRVVHFLDGRLS